jgi:hypothetical protein
MNPVQGPKILVLPELGPLTPPVLRVFGQIADRQPDNGLDQWERSTHPAPPADLHVQPLLPVGREDFLLIDPREVIERERESFRLSSRHRTALGNRFP